MSTPANFNGQKPTIDPADAAMLLIDHQSGLFQTVGDMPMRALRNHAAALAKMATLCKLPVVTTASVPQGPNGPLIPEIHQNAPHAQYVARRGEINTWDNPDFVADAVGGTSVTAHEMALRRIEQAGGKMISVPQLFCELQRDWQRKETVPAFMNLFIETGGTAGLQFSYDKAE